ncbi:MAG: hypothetical protein ACKO1O_02555 [Erythrobacter sp.]
MNRRKSHRTVVPPSFFAKLALPFALPIASTLALVVLVGEAWPRNIAPGSGLKLAGLLATAVLAYGVWLVTVRSIPDRRAHQMAALVCGVTGLMGWPVWSVGIMPSINGLALGPEQTVTMILDRTEATSIKHSREQNHWAWLHPASPGGAVGAGRYFIPEATYQRWNLENPRSVRVTIAEGLLGAQVVTRYE